MNAMPSVSILGLVPIPPIKPDPHSEHHALPARAPCEVAQDLLGLRPSATRLATKSEIARIRDELKAIAAVHEARLHVWIAAAACFALKRRKPLTGQPAVERWTDELAETVQDGGSSLCDKANHRTSQDARST